MGFIDFAGATVIHMTGGFTALACVIHIGPRLGFGTGKIIPNNLSIYTLGIFLLFVGWIGFNGGSTLAYNDSIPGVLLNTFLAASTGGITMVLYFLLRGKKLDVVSSLMGIISGLVGVSAGCHILPSHGAIITGMLSALCAYWAWKQLLKFNIDDAVFAFPTHGVAAIVGTLCIALLGPVDEFGGASRLEQLFIQSTGVFAAAVWAFGVGSALMWLASKYRPFRVSEQDEIMGLNVSEHDAYTESQMLLNEMEKHKKIGDLSHRVKADPYTEVGQIASQYNSVIDQIEKETKQQEKLLYIIKNQVRETELIIKSSTQAVIGLQPDFTILGGTLKQRLLSASMKVKPSIKTSSRPYSPALKTQRQMAYLETWIHKNPILYPLPLKSLS